MSRLSGYLLVATVISVQFCTGCSLLPGGASKSVVDTATTGDAPGFVLKPNRDAAMLSKVEQAKDENAIVLHVSGDSGGPRTLPLPPEGQSVSVGDLLQQTGLGDRLGAMQARVHRQEHGQPESVRMDVLFNGKTVRPETDYALRPGDVVQVRRDPNNALSRFMDGIIPGNALKGVMP